MSSCFGRVCRSDEISYFSFLFFSFHSIIYTYNRSPFLTVTEEITHCQRGYFYVFAFALDHITT